MLNANGHKTGIITMNSIATAAENNPLENTKGCLGRCRRKTKVLVHPGVATARAGRAAFSAYFKNLTTDTRSTCWPTTFSNNGYYDHGEADVASTVEQRNMYHGMPASVLINECLVTCGNNNGLRCSS